VRSDIGAGGNRRLDHFRAIFLQLNRRLNLLNVVEQGVFQKSLRSQAVERKVLASQLSAERDFGDNEQFDEGTSRRRA
jgi:hypothetical protein